MTDAERLRYFRHVEAFTDGTRHLRAEGDRVIIVRADGSEIAANYTLADCLDKSGRGIWEEFRPEDDRRPSLLNCSFDELFAAYRALEAERDQLKAWKEDALKALAASDVLHEALKPHGHYLGWNVHDAIVDLLHRTEAERDHLQAALVALRQQVESLHRFEAEVPSDDRAPGTFHECVLWSDVCARLTPAPSPPNPEPQETTK